MKTGQAHGPDGREALRLFAALVVCLSAASAAGAADATTITVASRVRAGGETSLLVETAGPAGKVADEITLSLPSNLASKVTPAQLPAGWSAAREGSSLRLSGPAAPLPLRLRLDAAGVEAPARVSARVRSRGATLLETDVNVTRAAAVKPFTSLEGLLVLPKTLYAGDLVTFEALDPARTPGGGRWTVAGSPAEEIPTSGRPGSTFRLRIPGVLRAGEAISVSYTDPWGERVADVPEAARCGGSPPTSSAGRPRLEACAPMAFAGQAACVCGWFPTDAAREGLTLNGKPLGAPATASSGVVFVRIPADTPPGPARIGGLESAGYSASDQATTIVLRVGGEIDRNKLMRGESTPMRLWVEGTAQPLKLKIRNDTPEIIRLEGGNDQLASTDGKTPNGLTRTVYGVHAGDFKINYSLAADSCPCSGETVPQTETRPTPTATPGGHTSSRDTPPPTKTPTPTETPFIPRRPPTPPPPNKPECKLTFVVEGGPGISIEAVSPAPLPTSKKNEPIPLFVYASDMDQLLQTCTCYIDGVPVSTTHKYIDVPDTVQYRWYQSKGKGTLAGKVGPATLYQPLALKVGESDSATIQAQMVDVRDNDKPAYVTFTITVKREEECKYRRTFSAEKKSDPGRNKASTDVTQGITCDPQEPLWETPPAPIQAEVPGKLKVCVGERALLTASGSDQDLLTLRCQGRCGLDKSTSPFDDPVKYTWRADKGGFPDYGGQAKTNSDSTSVIYVAPAKPGPDVVHVHVEDSGKEKQDTPLDKTIPITAYKLELLVEGDKDESDPNCDAYYICLNDDDDDEKGVDDRQPDPDKVAGEEDRVKITLKMEPEKSGNVILDALNGKQRIRVWTAAAGGKQVALPYTVPKLPINLWVEGIQASAASRDVELLLRSDDPHCEVHTLFTVEGPELDMDGVDHAARVNPGGSICVNKDFENDPTKQVMDKDNPVADPDKEHDLVPITLDKNPKEGSVTFEVSRGGNRVRVWEKSADGKNLKGSRAEGNGYNAADLPVTLWVEGISGSDAERDVTLELTDDDSGCVSKLLLTVTDVTLKVAMRGAGGALAAVPEARKVKPGAFLSVNGDDDDENGVLDLNQHPNASEDDLARITLDKHPRVGAVTLRATAGIARIRLWDSPTKQNEINLAAGKLTYGPSDLPRELWVEAVQPSGGLGDIELKLESDDPHHCQDTAKLTAVRAELTVRKPLVIDAAETAAAAKDKLTKGVQTFVNLDNDDQDDKYDTGASDVAVAGENEMVKATLVLEPAVLTGTAKLTATAGGADVKFWTAANKGTEYAAGSALAVPAAFTAAGNVLTKDLWVEGVSPHTAQRGTRLRFDYDDASGFEGHDRASLTILGIDKIQFVGKNNSRSDDNTLDADPNWPAGLAPGSVRVFPDARIAAAGGGIEASARDKVDVKVTLTVAPIEPVKLYFRSFDVDDPTSAAAPLDDETKDEDNRGTSPAREGAFPGAVDGVKEVTFDGKEKTFEFQVTMQPGDNFRIVGNGDRKFLLDLDNPDSTLGADNADKQRIINKFITGTSAEKEIRDSSHYASDRVLTVWRFLHVERDHMGAPPAAEVFLGAGVDAPGGGGAVQGDDDVDPGGASGDPDIGLAQAEYRSVYVETVDDLAALNTRRTTAFVHNLRDANAAATGNGIRDVASVDRFWVIHVVGCYEGEPLEDFDPNTEAACYGYTPASCMIYFETIRDGAANKAGSVARGVFEQRTVLHESLHSVFTYAAIDDHGTGGIMVALTSRTGNVAQNHLNDRQKHYIRKCDRPRP